MPYQILFAPEKRLWNQSCTWHTCSNACKFGYIIFCGASQCSESLPYWLQAASVDAKLLAALLAGVRRAFPFVDPTDTAQLMEVHSTSLFTVTHTATFGVAVQALSLLFQLLDAGSSVSDRFYRYRRPLKLDCMVETMQLTMQRPLTAITQNERDILPAASKEQARCYGLR